MKLLCCLLALAAGCVPIQHGGKTYHLVVGIGIVRVSQTNEVTVVKSVAAGLYAGDGRVNFGLSSIYSAHVPTNANVLLEVK